MLSVSFVVMLINNIITVLGRSPVVGHGNPLQYSYLKNPTDRGSLVGYSPHCLKESDATEVIEHADAGIE